MNDYQPSLNLVAHVKQAEGLVLVPAPDAAGYLTWGYGHKHRPGEAVPTLITEEQADNWLTADLMTAGGAVRRLVTVELTQDQFDGITDFTFNLGEAALAGSTMLRMINAQNFSAASVQCQSWDHATVAGQLVVLAGLKVRRAWDAEHIDPEPTSVVWSAETDLSKPVTELVFPPIDVPTLTEVVPDPNLQQAIEQPSVP